MQTDIYRQWINSKVLLYSTGNYIKYLVISYNEKESEKDIYICNVHMLNVSYYDHYIIIEVGINFAAKVYVYI